MYKLLVCLLAAGAVVTSVWDGVFTAEQADRGRSAYQEHCAGCHGEDLRGRSGRALAGERFWQDWSEDRLSSLYRVIQDTMPRTRPHSLDDAMYADIVAFVLSENGIPGGSIPLTGQSSAEIQVVRKTGPGPVPNSSLVSVVGCLARSSAATSAPVWTVIRASELVRSRNPERSKDEERSRAESTQLSSHVFELMDADVAATGLEGRRVEVKGLLIRGAQDKINITSIQALAERCEP